MSARQRYKDSAKKREGGGFVALPHAVLTSPEFAHLSPFALKALMDLLSQFRGDNNGDLCAAWSIMKERGWNSRDSLGKGLRELRDKDFVLVTRQGGRHVASLYAVTFYEVDACNGKLDVKAPSRAHMGAWRRLPPPMAVIPNGSVVVISVTRPSGQLPSDCPACRVNAKVSA